MTRRIIEQTILTVDRDQLQVVTIYEPGINKQTAKAENQYCKRHKVLVKSGDNYEFLQKEYRSPIISIRQ